MADTGAPHSIPYPIAADAPAGHTQMQSLATQVAARLGALGYLEVATSQTAPDTTPGDPATAGPSVTLTVPTNGLVAVMAQVTFASTTGTGTVVHLMEDGSSIGQILAATTNTTRYTTGGSTTGVTTRPTAGWLVFPATAGSRVYKLAYAKDPISSGTVSARKIWVRTFPF